MSKIVLPLGRRAIDAAVRQAHLMQVVASGGLQLDADDTATLDRQLRFVEKTLYEIKYPQLKHDQFIPLDQSVPVGAESVELRTYDQVGDAKILDESMGATDVPAADATASVSLIKLKPIGAKYSFSVMDLERTALSGVALDQLRARACRNAIESKIDYIACFGNAPAGLHGFLNNSSVPIVAATTVGGIILWKAKTGAEIVADLNLLCGKIPLNTLDVYEANTILLSSDLYTIASTTPFSAGGGSDRTVLEWFRQNNPGVQIEKWNRLNAAAADGYGRAMAYFKSPEILQEKLPERFRQLPPQANGYQFVNYVFAVTSGTHVHVPKAICYMDGASDGTLS